jgi:hypothetical protein
MNSSENKYFENLKVLVIDAMNNQRILYLNQFDTFVTGVSPDGEICWQ